MGGGADSVTRRLTVRGTVQGVGFRPFVYRLATELGLAGRVFNAPQGLVLEVRGTPANLEALSARLQRDHPIQASVQQVLEEPAGPLEGDDFTIVASTGDGELDALVPPDIATCDPCRAEEGDAADRRYSYPFTNCTDCGPRFTIVHRLPYDRAATTMAGFPLCDACAAEYGDPADRRFHAQPNACAVCGPRIWLTDPAGEPLPADDTLADVRQRLAAGQVVAVQGLGGYHLACDATQAGPVQRLRQRKRRPHQPFAVMARDLQVAQRLARVSDAEAALLTGWRAPIVLLPPRADALPPAVSGTSGLVGVMLPYTPLHHGLLAGPCDVLVMTSGNHRGAPMAHTHEAGYRHLAPLVDCFLQHDRPIARRADDSVVRRAGEQTVLLRRSRGWVPAPVTLPTGGSEQLALGGDLKATCAVTRGDRAFLSQHVGDLAHPEALAFLERAAADLLQLLGVRPQRVVHDAHPDYHATRLALRLGQALGVDTLAVQHHHAHALACLAENGWDDPALAVVLDGAGYGTDGVSWGGELLWVHGLQWRRVAHLTPLPLPGGDRAATEPWRMAAAALSHAAPDRAARVLNGRLSEAKVPPAVVQGVLALCGGGEAPQTTSAGRLFDAAAALLGLRQRCSFEAQAAMQLEQAATAHRTDDVADFTLRPGDDHRPARLDLVGGLVALAGGEAPPADVARAARVFHNTLCAAFAAAARQGREQTGADVVALSGGVLQNRLVHEGLTRRLTDAGFRVLSHRQVPPNDGGLSLGQAWAGVLTG